MTLPDPLWPWILGAYLAASLSAFLAYGFDKRQARTGGRRIPEQRLHLAALVGGFPGAWLGRRTFRHKTQKGAFGVVLLLAALLHLGLWGFLLTR